MNLGYKIENQELVAVKFRSSAKKYSAKVFVSSLYPALKRLTDISVALIALVALMPLMLITALLIVVESSGSALFQQTRVGERGREFKMWKFRSMCNNSEDKKQGLKKQGDVSDGVRFKMENDPRITGIGRIIRKLSIDELPQLVNVLKGDMSLVGPRPALPDEVSKYTPWQRLRLNAKPGITCIWQVSGRSSIPFLQQVEMDIDYIRKANLAMDFGLLLKTIPAVLFARGAH